MSRPNINVNNIIIGTMNIEHVGTMTITRYLEKSDGRVRKCPD